MPLEHALWRIGSDLSRLPVAKMNTEDALEDYIFRDPDILNDGWLIIGRQVATDFGKFIDLLAIDGTGSLILIELKKDQTPREVVAQAIDYASWVQELASERIADIFQAFVAKYRSELSGKTLDDVFRDRFHIDLPEDELNASHQIVIVAAQLDNSTERIVRYLADRGIDINIAFFRVFVDNDHYLLSLAWFIDPIGTDETARKPTPPRTNWNGEYYASFGHNDHRDWDDAIRYSFISAGGGTWYSNTLSLLVPGAQVWVNVPGRGYVGVCEVENPPVRIDQFMVKLDDGSEVPITEAPLRATKMKDAAQQEADTEKAEYLVRVKWLRTVPLAKAVHEVGFFGNQNSVCRPTTPKWNHTVERLKQRFDVAVAAVAKA
jgi:hypothetical protein